MTPNAAGVTSVSPDVDSTYTRADIRARGMSLLFHPFGSAACIESDRSVVMSLTQTPSALQTIEWLPLDLVFHEGRLVT